MISGDAVAAEEIDGNLTEGDKQRTRLYLEKMLIGGSLRRQAGE